MLEYSALFVPILVIIKILVHHLITSSAIEP